MKLHSLLTPEGRAKAQKIAAQLESQNIKIEFGGAMSLAASAVANLKVGNYEGRWTGNYGVHKYASAYDGVNGKYKIEVLLQDGKTKLYPNMPEDMYNAIIGGTLTKAIPVVVVVREADVSNNGRMVKFAQLQTQDWKDGATPATPPATEPPVEQVQVQEPAAEKIDI